MAKTEFRIWYNTKDDKKYKKSNIHVGWSIQVQRGKTTPWYINLMDENSWRCSTFAPDPQLSHLFDKLQELNANLDEGANLSWVNLSLNSKEKRMFNGRQYLIHPHHLACTSFTGKAPNKKHSRPVPTS